MGKSWFNPAPACPIISLAMLFLSETPDLREKLWSRLSIHTSISINCTWFGLSKFAVCPACLVSTISLNSELANVSPDVQLELLQGHNGRTCLRILEVAHNKVTDNLHQYLHLFVKGYLRELTKVYFGNFGNMIFR